MKRTFLIAIEEGDTEQVVHRSDVTSAARERVLQLYDYADGVEVKVEEVYDIGLLAAFAPHCACNPWASEPGGPKKFHDRDCPMYSESAQLAASAAGRLKNAAEVEGS